MLRKCFAFMLIVSLLCPVSVVAGIPESHMYHFTVMEMVEIPLAQALTEALGDDFTLLDCYATTRFHQWRYGQAVIRDGEGYALCCLDYLDGAWRVTVSHDALRQDEPPRLLPEGVEYGYTDEQVGQMDGCASFKIIYPDVTYRWFAGSDSWNMISVITEEEELDVSHDSLCRWNKGQDKVEWLLNVLPLDPRKPCPKPPRKRMKAWDAFRYLRACWRATSTAVWTNPWCRCMRRLREKPRLPGCSPARPAG